MKNKIVEPSNGIHDLSVFDAADFSNSGHRSVIIIGTGPAGLTAGIRTLSLDFLDLESNELVWILDFLDAESKQLVWQGWYVGAIEDPAVTKVEINKAVKHVLEDLPQPLIRIAWAGDMRAAR